MDFAMTALLAGMLAPDPAAVQVAEGQPVPMVIEAGRACLPDADVCLAVVADTTGGERAYRAVLSSKDMPMDKGKSQPLPCTVGDQEAPEIWPHVLPLAATAPGEGDGRAQFYLVGVLLKQNIAYSGGGAETSRLCLSTLGVGRITALGQELLNLPWRSSLLIRACFDDADRKKRLGACHDEYDYGTSLTLAPDGDGGSELPALIYRTQATAYPQTARRWEDSSALPPLKPSDLSRWRDPECSYSRTLRLNPATERYEMDRPAPDCQAYTAS